jgi:hypothetical protein
MPPRHPRSDGRRSLKTILIVDVPYYNNHAVAKASVTYTHAVTAGADWPDRAMSPHLNGSQPAYFLGFSQHTAIVWASASIRTILLAGRAYGIRANRQAV